MEYVTATVIAAGQLPTKQKQKQKSPDIIRDKTFLENGYQNWSNAMFKKKLRLRRETFEHILNYVRPHLEKTPTDMKPHPISVERQLAILCRHFCVLVGIVRRTERVTLVTLASYTIGKQIFLKIVIL